MKPQFSQSPVKQEAIFDLVSVTKQIHLFHFLAKNARALRSACDNCNRLGLVSITARVEEAALRVVSQISSLRDCHTEDERRLVWERITPSDLAEFASRKLQEQYANNPSKAHLLGEGLNDERRKSFSELFKSKGFSLSGFTPEHSFLFDEQVNCYLNRRVGNVYWFWELIRRVSQQQASWQKPLPLAMDTLQMVLDEILFELKSWFPAEKFIGKLEPDQWPPGLASVSVLNKTLMICHQAGGPDKAALVLNPLFDKSPLEPVFEQQPVVAPQDDIFCDRIDRALDALLYLARNAKEASAACIRKLFRNRVCWSKQGYRWKEVLAAFINLSRILDPLTREARHEQNLHALSSISRVTLFEAIQESDFRASCRNRINPVLYTSKLEPCSIRLLLKKAKGTESISCHEALSIICTEKAVQLIEAKCLNKYWLYRVLYQALKVSDGEHRLPLRTKDILGAMADVRAEEDWGCIPFGEDPSSWDPSAVLLASREGLLLLVDQKARASSKYDPGLMTVNPLFI